MKNYFVRQAIISPKIESLLQKLTTRILCLVSSFGPHVRLLFRTGEVSSIEGVQNAIINPDLLFDIYNGNSSLSVNPRKD